jgi:hypothetical protein
MQNTKWIIHCSMNLGKVKKKIRDATYLLWIYVFNQSKTRLQGYSAYMYLIKKCHGYNIMEDGKT